MYPIKLALLFLSILAGLDAYAQEAKVKTAQFEVPSDFNKSAKVDVSFPMVFCKGVSAKINNTLIHQILGEKYNEMPLSEGVEAVYGSSLTRFDYKVTYNKRGVLSLTIQIEACGAYCTYWEEYYNFSTETGDLLLVTDVLDMDNEFSAILKDDVKQRYDEERKLLKETLSEENSGLNKEMYNEILKRYNDCENSYDVTSFQLFPEKIVLNSSCEFPHMIRNYTPISSLAYTFIEIKKYMRIKL